MNSPSRHHALGRLFGSLLTVLSLALALPKTGRAQEKQPPLRNMDTRVSPGAPLVNPPGLSAAAIAQRQQAIAGNLTRGISQLKVAVPRAEVTVSPVTGGAEVVSAAGALTAVAPGRSGFDIVKEFLQSNASLYGLAGNDIASLHFIGESVSQASGLRMVRIEQRVNERPVFQSETRFTIDREGRLIRSVGLLVPDASAVAAPPSNTVSAPRALAAALASVNLVVDPDRMILVNTQPGGAKTDLITDHPQVTGRVPSELVYFPVAPGVLIPAWSQVTMTSTDAGDWFTLVDANTGALLWRKNIRAHASSQEARFSVFVQADGTTPADSPSPLSPTTATPGAGLQPAGIARTTVNMSTVQNIIASPNGWITDGGTTTTGNNVDAYLDLNSNNVPDPGTLDNNGRPTGNVDAFGRNRDFLGTGYAYTPPPMGGNPESGSLTTDTQHRRGIVTHLFYLSNWYHDRLYALGFDPAAGNFQTNNFGGGGVGNDPVLAEAQDAAGNVATSSNRNNANFSTPPDGQSGRMQMYIFTGPTVDRDGSLDAEIVLHELTHGLSNRLIGNGSGLNWDVGAGMGEGWSDFYALSLLNNSNTDNPDGKYAAGAYATYKLGGLTDNYLYGIRRFPYSTDNTVNPLTWADVDDTTLNISGGIAASPLNFTANGGGEVHNIGEIWCNSLWEVRSRVIADPAGANGNVPAGNNKMLQIVTDGMKMTPINPSFIDARDALIAADAATNSGANEKWIWQGFADRGLGYNAVAPISRMFGYFAGHLSIGESFDVPYLDVQSIAIDDSLGNGNGAIDPGESVKITVKLKNPWRAASFGVASAAATLSTSTAGVTITTISSTYPAIVALGSADGTPFQFSVPVGATAGQALKFTITPTSALGTKAVDFTLRVGTPAGNGAPIIYTRNIPGGLAIPDNAPRGVADTMTITDDYEIADLNFRIDSLVHTWTGDITALLRAPNGLGTDLISAVGGGVAGSDNGDNFVNTVIDDQAAGDLFTATAASAPFTGSWKPMFNVSSWDAALGLHDPVGLLSRYNGLSTKGDWKILVSDQAQGDTGTLNAWSLIVTPKAYTVTQPPLPVVTVAATDATAGEPGSGQGTGTFTFSRTGSTASALTVNYTVSGTATSGSDYTAIGTTVVFAAGSPTAAQTVSVIDEALVEGDETVVVTLASGSGYTVGSPSSATVTIRDDDSSTSATSYVTSVVLGTLRNNYSGWVGIQIIVGPNPLTVSQLGRMMAPGNSGIHMLKFVKVNDGTDVPGGSAAVGMSGGTLGEFRYGVLSIPVTLAAGTAYLVLSQETAGGDSWYNWDTQLTTTGVAVDNAVAWGTGPGDWNTYGVADRAHVPVDFKYGGTVVPVDRTLTVASSNPNSGVGITVSPGDNGGLGNGVTAFARTYSSNTVVTLTAPATAGGNAFQKWQKDGADWSTSLSTTATMDANHTLTAVFASSTISVTVQTSPSGRTFTVDGTSYSSLQTFSWSPGSNHTIATSSPQSGGAGTQYAWNSWSDGGAISHAVAPTSGTTYTANFTTQYFLTMSAGTGGTVSPAGGWYDANQSVPISASANGGYSFTGWTGSGSGSYSGSNNPGTVMMNGPIMETATFGVANEDTAYVTSVALGTLRSDYSGWVGIQIVVGANPVAVSQLGRMMALGNSGTHALKFVKVSDGTDVPGGSVTVAMSGGTPGQFRYGVLSNPVTLAAGAAYLVLSQETAGGDTWYNWDTQLTTTGVAVDNAVAWGTGPGNWNTYAVANRAHVPVDFKYGSTVQPVGRTLTVTSSNPISGVGITVSPADNGGFGDGITAFTRSYDGNTVVTLTAPATAAGNTFQKWQKDGVDWSANLSTTAMMDANHTMTAVYGGTEAAYVTSVVLGTLRNNYSGWVGIQIVVGANPVTVSKLGRMMAPGNSGTHALKLVKSSDGTDVPGGSVTVAMNGGTVDQFLYGVLNSPVTLAAGTTYLVLSQETAGGDTWYDWDTQLTTTGVAVDNAVAWGTGPGNWSTYGVANRAHVPVDFKY